MLTKLRQERHQDWKEQNLAIIQASGVEYIDRGETLLFRLPGKPKVDFYPSTGRWRLVQENKTYSGGAEKFLKFLERFQNKD